MVADLTGVSVASIFRARRELKIKGKLSTPKKSHSQIGITDRLTKYDDFEKTAIRRKVHDYFFRNECPTLKQLLTDVNKKFWILDGLLDEDVPLLIINTAESTESDTDLSDVEKLL